MANQTQVAWLNRSKVYHHHYRLRFRQVKIEATDGTAIVDDEALAPCGTVLYSPMARPQVENEAKAVRLGLRPCRRCFPGN